MKGEGCWGLLLPISAAGRDVVKCKFDDVSLLALIGVNTWQNRVP